MKALELLTKYELTSSQLASRLQITKSTVRHHCAMPARFALSVGRSQENKLCRFMQLGKAKMHENRTHSHD
jgi:hypothetical protein